MLNTKLIDQFDRINRFGFPTPIWSMLNVAYPPYNIRQFSETDFAIEIAAAGFDETDMEINLDGVTLTVTGEKKVKDNPESFVSRGLSYKPWEHKFTLNKGVQVENAEFVNGLLTIGLKRILPDTKPTQKIQIGKKSAKTLLTE